MAESVFGKPIDTAVKELNDNYTSFSEVSLSMASGKTGGLFARRYGRVVCINGYISSTSAFTTNELLATIESVNRPPDTIRTLVGVANWAYEAGDLAYLSISADGTIKISPKSGNTYKVCYFTASYIVES